MPYEKINTLIEQAPEVSQWWTFNKRALSWWRAGYIAASLPLFFVALLSVSATLLVCINWTIGSLPADKYWTLIAAPLVSVGSIGAMALAVKLWPKRFTCHNFTLKNFPAIETVSLAFVHNVLNKAVTINDPQMKPILARLSAIKDMDLPQCWWTALSKELDNLTPKAPVVTKSIEEKIDAVYVQIEDVAASPTPPKVLRL